MPKPEPQPSSDRPHPILTAYYLSRTGQYESAHVLSSLALTGLGTALVDDIVATARWVNACPEISVLVITGAGSAFCAGGNVKDMQNRSSIFRGSPAQLRTNYQRRNLYFG